MVSFRRHRYNSVTACRERRSANLVFTEPSLGALAMMTSVRFVDVIERRHRSFEISLTLQCGISRRPWRAVFSAAEIVERDAAENKPRRSSGASECAANLRFPDPGMIAYRNFDNAETLGGSL